MKKLIALLFLLPAAVHASGIYNPGSSGGGGGGSGIVSPGTFTWTNTFGMAVSTIAATGNITAADGTSGTQVVNYNQWTYTANSNILINGGMEVWQRATSIPAANGISKTYSADRWAIVTASRDNGLVIASREASTIHDGQFSFKLVTTSTAGVGDTFEVDQPIENYYDYAGSSVTLSFWVNSSSTSFASISDNLGNTFTPNTTGGIGWEYTTATRFLGSGITQLVIKLNRQGISPTTAYYYDSVMLVKGPDAIPYFPRIPQVELSMCQRYYENSFAATASVSPVFGAGNYFTTEGGQRGASTVDYFIPYLVAKRTTATVTFWDESNTSGKVSFYSTAGALTSRTPAGVASLKSGINFQNTTAIELSCDGNWAADAEMP